MQDKCVFCCTMWSVGSIFKSLFYMDWKFHWKKILWNLRFKQILLPKHDWILWILPLRGLSGRRSLPWTFHQKFYGNLKIGCNCSKLFPLLSIPPGTSCLSQGLLKQSITTCLVLSPGYITWVLELLSSRRCHLLSPSPGPYALLQKNSIFFCKFNLRSCICVSQSVDESLQVCTCCSGLLWAVAASRCTLTWCKLKFCFYSFLR